MMRSETTVGYRLFVVDTSDVTTNSPRSLLLIYYCTCCQFFGNLSHVLTKPEICRRIQAGASANWDNLPRDQQG